MAGERRAACWAPQVHGWSLLESAGLERERKADREAEEAEEEVEKKAARAGPDRERVTGRKDTILKTFGVRRGDETVYCNKTDKKKTTIPFGRCPASRSKVVEWSFRR